MLRSLLRKEWRQLRVSRWAGAGFGLLLPLLLLALVGANDRGWLTGIPTSTSAATVLGEVLPLALACGLWPLLTLMTAASALSADRAAGTDAFLLERPVARYRVWLARVLAALGTATAIAAANVAVWWLLSRLAAGTAYDELYWLGVMAKAGAVGIAVALAAGAAAGSLARTPIQAMLTMPQ